MIEAGGILDRSVRSKGQRMKRRQDGTYEAKAVPARRTVARIEVRGIGRMTKRGRRDVAEWLHKLADEIADNGDEYTEERFTARFGYEGPLRIGE